MNLGNRQTSDPAEPSRLTQFSKSGYLTPTLVGILCVILLIAAHERGHGNYHKIRERVIRDSGVFDGNDVIPLPCNPETISIAYGLRNGRNVVPIMSMLPREELIASLPNAISLEKQPALVRKMARQWDEWAARSYVDRLLGGV